MQLMIDTICVVADCYNFQGISPVFYFAFTRPRIEMFDYFCVQSSEVSNCIINGKIN